MSEKKTGYYREGMALEDLKQKCANYKAQAISSRLQARNLEEQTKERYKDAEQFDQCAAEYEAILKTLAPDYIA